MKSVDDLLLNCGIIEPPVDLDILCQFLNIDVYYIDNLFYDAKKSNRIINLRNNMSNIRKRITLSHCIGLKNNCNIYSISEPSMFVKELLVPSWMFSVYSYRLKNNLFDLSILFQVPISIIETSLKYLVNSSKESAISSNNIH